MASEKFDKHSKKLVFEFENKEAANQFKLWLCEQGEQEYWNWMEYREQDTEEGDITGLDFEYHSGTDVIKVKCGRLDR